MEDDTYRQLIGLKGIYEAQRNTRSNNRKYTKIKLRKVFKSLL